MADELWEFTGHQYAFVELTNLSDTKGGTHQKLLKLYCIIAVLSQPLRTLN